MPKQISIYNERLPIIARRWPVAAGAVGTIQPGTPVKIAGTRGTSGVAAPMVTTDGTTSQCFLGIAKSVSTDTAAASGEVYVYDPLPGVIYAAQPSTTTAANTAAKLDAFMGARLNFTLTGTIGTSTGQWTINTASGDGATNCAIVVGGEYQTNTIHFVYKVTGTVYGI